MSHSHPTLRSVVIPCFNEAGRLAPAHVLALAAAPALTITLVDDGSTDDTWAVLDSIAARGGGRVRAVRLQSNVGKGEAVRAGLLDALGQGAAVVGYLDADFSAPPREMLRILAALDDPGVDVALGSRVQLLGRKIERRAVRHYLGRVFATASSMVLQAPVYDTQCGAKAFRTTDALRAALAAAFTSRWAFDVELLGRLVRGGPGIPRVPLERFVEVPLEEWREMQGSRMSSTAMMGAALDLLRIARASRRG